MDREVSVGMVVVVVVEVVVTEGVVREERIAL